MATHLKSNVLGLLPLAPYFLPPAWFLSHHLKNA